MKATRILSALVVVVGLTVTVVAQQRSATNGPLALVGGTLIDGTGGAPMIGG